MRVVPAAQFLLALYPGEICRRIRTSVRPLRSEILDCMEIRGNIAKIQFQLGRGVMCFRDSLGSRVSIALISLVEGVLGGAQQISSGKRRGCAGDSALQRI